MKVSEVVLVALLAIFFSGCSRAIHVTHVYDDSLEGRRIFHTSYNIGERIEAFTGAQILSAEPIWLSTKIHAGCATSNSTITIDGRVRHFAFIGENIHLVLMRGAEYKVTAEWDYFGGGEKVYLVNAGNHNIFVTEDGKIVIDGVASASNDRFYSGYMTVEPESAKLNLARCTKEISQMKEPYSELIYGGVDNLSISIMYREYSGDDRIRPAFSQQLKYPANSSKIRFRDYLLEVYEANSEKIVFSVLADGFKENERKSARNVTTRGVPGPP